MHTNTKHFYTYIVLSWVKMKPLHNVEKGKSTGVTSVSHNNECDEKI